MEIENPINVESFLFKTQNILEKDEVCGNLIYGLANTLLKNKYFYGNSEPFFSIIYAKNDIKIMGLMTPPHGINIYQNGSYDDNSMELFVDNIFEHFPMIPGIKGEKNITEKFVQKWINKLKMKSFWIKTLDYTNWRK